MKIVGVAACTAGIAHTYISKERVVNAAESRGHDISIETQGTIGIEDKLKEQDIKEADVVIFMTDISVTGQERFKGKNIIEVSTDTAIKSPNKLIIAIEEKMKGK